jgi:hypothetical protein
MGCGEAMSHLIGLFKAQTEYELRQDMLYLNTPWQQTLLLSFNRATGTLGVWGGLMDDTLRR